MKITINVDCTPEEARAFLGLPEVGPMQAKLMAELEKRTLDALKGSDAEALLKTWLPASVQTWEAMQKMFWSQMAASGKKAGGGSDKKTS